MRPAPITAASKHRIYGTSRVHEKHLTGTVMVRALTRLLHEKHLTGTVMVRGSPGGANQMRLARITAASKHRTYGTSRLHEKHFTGTVMVRKLTTRRI